MIFSIFRKFFVNIASLFSSKSVQPQTKPSTNSQSQTLGSQIKSGVNSLLKTVKIEAKNSVTRSVPTLEVVNIRFSESRKKYISERTAKKLVAKKYSEKLVANEYAVGRHLESTADKVATPNEVIIINNSAVSKYQFSIQRVKDKHNRDRYFLRHNKYATNETFKREPMLMSLLFWRHSKEYQNKPMWIPFFNWKCKKVKNDIELRHGDVLIIGEPEARDDNGKITNPQLKFVYPPVWYVRIGIYAAQGLLALILLYIFTCGLLVRNVSDVAVEPLPVSPAPLAIFANDSKTLMAGGQATPHQEKKQLSEFPQLLIQTVMESEDKIFYRHNGINIFRIFSAAFDNLKNKGISSGASTIDQQLARTLFAYEVNGKDMWGNKIPYDPQLQGTKDTLDRKIREAGIALKLNSTYRSKDDILLAYLNSVELGYRNTGAIIRGFADASLFYFNKPVENLSDKSPEDIARIANLVVLLRAPSVATSLCDKRLERSNLAQVDPTSEIAKAKAKEENNELDQARDNVIFLKNKRNGLIDAIRDRGYISREVSAQAKKFTNYTLFDNKKGFCQGVNASSDDYKYSPYFITNRIREEMRVILSISEQEEKEQRNGVFDNYIVVASLDVEKQDNARRLLERSLEKLWRDKAVPHGALITINPKNGEILALVGEKKAIVKVDSPDPTKREQEFTYDYAATELLSPASTFKIFFYTAALKGDLRLDRVYPCESLDFEGENFPVNIYSHYCAFGNRSINVRTAVALSDNLVPLKVVKEYANMAKVVETARDMGIRSQLNPPTPRMAYGQYKAVLREMTGAYAVLANGGKYNFPHAIRAIYLNTNKDDCDSTAQKFKNCPLLYDKDVRKEKQVISKDVADKMTDLLRGVVSDGTGKNADIRSVIGKDIAGKTGTIEGDLGVWFIGYIPDELVTGVWLGDFNQPTLIKDPPPTQDFNSGDAAQLWGDYMLSCHLPKGCSK